LIRRSGAFADIQEYVEIMGGLDSPGWMYFKKLFKEGFEIARKHSDSLISEFDSLTGDLWLPLSPS
jgi:phosphatidylinositol kinase/protein kinase (PI-3  family)